MSGVKWAAGEVTAANIEGGDSALATVGFDDDVFAVGILLDIYFAKRNATFFQEGFGASAIRAPSGAVDGDGVHGSLFRIGCSMRSAVSG